MGHSPAKNLVELMNTEGLGRLRRWALVLPLPWSSLDPIWLEDLAEL